MEVLLLVFGLLVGLAAGAGLVHAHGRRVADERSAAVGQRERELDERLRELERERRELGDVGERARLRAEEQA
ncbi:MAG: hypothetical protein M3P95_09900, partial [Actinomycetota bacterium]|nr:hypothetical protein [Actinomycetota bacterium]